MIFGRRLSPISIAGFETALLSAESVEEAELNAGQSIGFIISTLDANL
jgi:hypothetical protein